MLARFTQAQPVGGLYPPGQPGYPAPGYPAPGYPAAHAGPPGYPAAHPPGYDMPPQQQPYAAPSYGSSGQPGQPYWSQAGAPPPQYAGASPAAPAPAPAPSFKPSPEQQWAALKQRLDLAPTHDIASSLEAIYVFFTDDVNRATIGRQAVLDAIHQRKAREADWPADAASATGRVLQKFQ